MIEKSDFPNFWQIIEKYKNRILFRRLQVGEGSILFKLIISLIKKIYLGIDLCMDVSAVILPINRNLNTT